MDRGPVRDRCRAGPRGRPLGQRALAHLIELGPGGHLLGHQGGLDAVEQALQPADQLGMGDPQFGVRRGRCVERDGDPVQLGGQVGRQALGQLPDRLLVDLTQTPPAGLVEGGLADLFQELLDHRADAEQLGRLLDRFVGPRSSARPPRPVAGRGFGSWAPTRGPGRAGSTTSGRSGCGPSVGGRAGALSMVSVPISAQCHQGNQHLVRGQRAVAAVQPILAGVGRVHEGDRRIGRNEGHVTQPVERARRRSGPPNRPSSTSRSLLMHPGGVAVASAADSTRSAAARVGHAPSGSGPRRRRSAPWP